MGIQIKSNPFAPGQFASDITRLFILKFEIFADLLKVSLSLSLSLALREGNLMHFLFQLVKLESGYNVMSLPVPK